MQLYPALKARMGDWDYYIVKMRMKDVAIEVKFGSQVHNDFTLDEAIQRTIKESRVKKEIVTYLTRRPDRFFASLVVAAIGGSPSFFPVSISDDPQFGIFAGEEGIEDTFGLLRFSGTQSYYALDGQHRLKAIKTLLQPDDDQEWVEPPSGFENEEISVLMVLRPEDVDADKWLTSYRRLFSSLNRYAKPTDKDTNIIMDEDDTIAIITRRLISTHDFFMAEGRHIDSIKIQTKGRALSEGTSYFTSLQQLYYLNQILLTTPLRSNVGWGPDSDSEFVDIKQFIRYKPDDDYVDELYNELEQYWNALIEVIPELTTLKPSEARNHQADGTNGGVADNALFWPIGQEVMIRIARALLNKRLSDPTNPTLNQAKSAIKPLSKVDWNLHNVPWRGLLLVYASNTQKWTMRSEDRKNAMNVAEQLLRWITGIYPLDSRDEIELKQVWEARLGHLPDDDNTDEMWERIQGQCQISSD